jgi:diguanylate cyclase (GGDEF)-like protein
VSGDRTKTDVSATRHDPQNAAPPITRDSDTTPSPETAGTRTESFSAIERPDSGDLGETELIVIAHPEARAVGSRIRIPPIASVTIGRGESADLRLTGSPSVSRHHATFRFNERTIDIEDAGSRNGTFVNGRRIEGRVELISGDRIQVGGVHCKFLRELDVEAAYHDALLELATRDGLTGAHNRRFFEDELAREVARAQRAGHSLALVVLDVDLFKSVNDSYGHVVGDQVLRELVSVARGSLRSEQMLARVGGEEFAILCPETRGDDAAVLAERLRAAIAGHAMVCLADGGRVTCSFGVAELAPGGDAAAELYRRADEALYRSKTGGRNRVTQ